MFLAHLTGAGSWEWAGSIGNAGQSEFVDAIAANPVTHSVDIAGSFGGTVDFDFGARVVALTAVHATGNGNGYVAKYTAAGTFGLSRTFEVT